MNDTTETTLVRLHALVHLLRTENAQLRAAVANADARLTDAQLVAERAGLEPAIRQALGLPEDAPVNWQAVQQWCQSAAVVSPAT